MIISSLAKDSNLMMMMKISRIKILTSSHKAKKRIRLNHHKFKTSKRLIDKETTLQAVKVLIKLTIPRCHN